MLALDSTFTIYVYSHNHFEAVEDVISTICNFLQQQVQPPLLWPGNGPQALSLPASVQYWLG